MPDNNHPRVTLTIRKNPVTSYRCDDWSQLAGTRVEIRRHRKSVRIAIVDAVMPDSTMLWLAADQNDGRILLDWADGYEVWADPLDLPDSLYSQMICEKPHAPLVQSLSQ